MDSLLGLLRDVSEPIDNILRCTLLLADKIFHLSSPNGYAYNSYIHMLMGVIMNSPLLMVSLSLVFCGFVIGIIKRLITS